MATRKVQTAQVAAFFESVQRQFRNLDPKKSCGFGAICRAISCARAFRSSWLGPCGTLWLQDSDAELQAERAKEVRLRDDYSKKLAQAVNLEALKKQREQVLQYVTQMEKQLPSKAEMDALLSDINQAGIGRSLQFDLFRPGQVSVKEYYAELPIAIRVTGRYNDIGLFTSDIAYLSRIVTLNNLTLLPARDGSLSLDATAKTFRYLDPEEVAAQRQAAAPKGGKK
jgi:type IV pilus assembly protein PilO